jgi:hypothetical protein
LPDSEQYRDEAKDGGRGGGGFRTGVPFDGEAKLLYSLAILPKGEQIVRLGDATTDSRAEGDHEGAIAETRAAASPGPPT